MKTTSAFIVSLITFTLNAQTSELKLASDVWPPFTGFDSSASVAIKLVKEALLRTKIQTHTEIHDFKAVMSGINGGTFDGSAALWRSPERDAVLLFSEPYLENRLILVGKKGSDVNARSFSELNGKRIAVVASYAYGLIPGNVKNIKLVPGTSDQQNLEHLLAGKADYMLVDALLIEYLLQYQNKEATEYLEIGNNALLTMPLHFAIRKDIPDAKNIMANFNNEIKKMIAEGVYNKILNLNWIDTDVDGDGKTEYVLNGDEAGTQAPVKTYMMKSTSPQVNAEARGYYIKGIRYSDWNQVPERYKVPPRPVSPNDKIGFGPVFRF